jgi:hypothetical protein
LVGLVVLLANDLVLKQTYPGVLTGKLSDVAGLFTLPMFLSAWRPRRARETYLAVAVMFAWWKTPWSNEAIDGWNALGWYEIGRVVDYTDLLALAALPLSLAYLHRVEAKVTSCRLRRTALPFLGLMSILSFGASLSLGQGITSLEGEFFTVDSPRPPYVYVLDFPSTEWSQRLDASGHLHSTYQEPGGASSSTFYEISLDNDCRKANVEVLPTFDGTAVHVTAMLATKSCIPNQNAATVLREEFETGLIARLRGATAPLEMVSETNGEQFLYAVDERPMFEVSLTLDEFAASLDKALCPHEVHGNSYYIGGFLLIRALVEVDATDRENITVRVHGYWFPDEEADDDDAPEAYRDASQALRLVKITLCGASLCDTQGEIDGTSYSCSVRLNPGEPTPISPPSLSDLAPPTCAPSQLSSPVAAATNTPTPDPR